MTIVSVIIVVALAFGGCYLVDKGFTKFFRSRPQHQSGKAVKGSKRYPIIGTVLMVLGVAGMFQGGMLLFLGLIVIAMGAALVVYYLSFGVYYDDDSFLITAFGKPGREYAFRDIQTQQLYLIAGGNMVVELHMADGKAVSLQSMMEGVYPFLDHAFAAWCRQTGTAAEDCPFHDPSTCCWFPPAQEPEEPAGEDT